MAKKLKSPPYIPNPRSRSILHSLDPKRPVNTLTHLQHLVLRAVWRYGKYFREGECLEQDELKQILHQLYGEEGFHTNNISVALKALLKLDYLELHRHIFIKIGPRLRYSITDKGKQVVKQITEDMLEFSAKIIDAKSIRWSAKK